MDLDGWMIGEQGEEESEARSGADHPVIYYFEHWTAQSLNKLAYL